MTTKLYVGNLAYGVTEIQIQELFSPVGEVLDVYLSKNRYTSKSSGFGFVQIATVQAAHKIIEGFHGYLLMGRSMTVKEIAYSDTSKWQGTSGTVIYRKITRPPDAAENTDGKSKP